MSEIDEMTIWENIGKDSYQVEHSMDSLHRKQTGSYYTALDLTFAMMKEMVASLPPEKRASLFDLTFLEPCVGTGNFVFAYLRVCKSLNFTKEQYQVLLNNIYVCDINDHALSVYKKNLCLFSTEYFGITLDDAYFDSHLGRGLLVDVDSDSIRYIPITDVFPASIVKDGFDFVVTNPPYKNLKAEKGHYATEEQYDRDKAKYAEIGKLATRHFSYSAVGTINIYKLFVEEIAVHYLAPDGIGSLLIPASILSDKTCAKLRTMLLETSSVKSIRIIEEDSNYVDASQALCAMLFHKGSPSSEIYVDGSFNGDSSNGAIAPISDLIDASTGNAILVLTAEQYALRRQMRTHPTIKDLSYITNLRGELDLTMNKSAITSTPTPFRLIRGRNIGYYELLDLADTDYVAPEFVERTTKKIYIEKPRLICQQIANMAKKRRVSFSLVPESCVLGNSCNFVTVADNDDGVDAFFVLGVLNSSLIDWYFKLTSSNNHINNYEIDNFPIPVSFPKKEEISIRVQKLLKSPHDQVLEEEIERLVREAYGIDGLNEGSKESEGNKTHTVFNDHATLVQSFVRDLKILVPSITEDECQELLDGKQALNELMAQTEYSPFDRKVIEGIVRKYIQLNSGGALNHTTFKLSALDLEMIKPVPQGGSWKDIPVETVRKSKRLERITQTGGRTTLYGRIDYKQPSYTITTYFNRPGNGTYVHPVHERVLSVREAARFQCFPDTYQFCGNKTDMLKQVGNAVPVLLAYNIGRAIREKTGCRTSVDLFSGAGGMTYGFKCAGIDAVVANDIVEPACITLKVNNPEIPVICGDITVEETKARIVEKGLEGGADIICGGPPCQGFSMAGWRMKDDPRNQLFRHFIDIVSRVNPKVIVFENVEGILSYQGGSTYRDIITLFSELGYNTEGRKLMANHYGAPQRRKRVIILCTRKDIGVLPSEIFPDPITPNQDRQITAYDTIFDLEQVECSEQAKYASDYQSDILQFLKGDISVEEYVHRITDERGVISADQGENDADDDDSSLEEAAKPKSNPGEDCVQLTLFDLL